MNFKKKIFSILSKKEFDHLTWDIFHYQIKNNKIYKNYLKSLEVDPFEIKNISEIPFLPISFFKTHRILSSNSNITDCYDVIFTSSGTTGIKSKHYVKNLSVYIDSIRNSFEFFYGPIEKFKFLGFFPTKDRKDSSLIYMVKYFIQKTYQNGSHFVPFTSDKDKNIHMGSNQNDKNILIFGPSFSLLDFIDKYHHNKYKKKEKVIIMETGGMKGKRKEIIREELHDILKKFFCVKEIHSEYGMTELLSQAYAKKNGIFKCPPWMKIYIRDPEDPFIHVDNNKIGGIDIIDLSNYLSCPFISTEDLGKKINENEFEVLGRMDFSDMRGCNLMTI
ncbi:LuxE family acyl-protein synthetase/acyl-CoA reductase [Blattabacterium sp. (Blaberus giganteus)]|uniref:LuxE family acyl-protein synthetase/acyl-CoA reductase n=1 Tax=Blattabacterium sp. (Blaberus giganteus) TaxID=1186051 RepID=UPI00025F6F13|nr:LuxE family acyl-protein synthetase/acyl-CoA reductase [Blattabacterium sp. (Blaberus giganteus)]AFJ90715.1 acyl protein synthetase [Blattabacterium sp. (Blaberus giganteus)]